MRTSAKTNLLFTLFLAGPFAWNVVSAQFDPPPLPPPPTADSPESPDKSVPIDGGLVVLLAAGAGYGLKKYRSYRHGQPGGRTDRRL